MKITCESLNKTIQIDRHSSLMFALKEHDIPIASSCRGYGACKWCKIRILKGIEHLSKKSTHEKNTELAENERLSCQCKTHGDITIDTSYW